MKRRPRGFTLIELMVVIAIIAVLAAILVPNYQLARAQGIVTACKQNLASFGRAFEMYAVDNSGEYPTIPSQIIPQYLPKMPTCPSYGGTYNVTSSPPPTADYTVSCVGLNHPQLGIPDDYPQYTGSAGLVIP